MERIRCFIVDDEKPAVERLSCLLKKCDYTELSGAETNADAAVKAICRQKPELVFIDVELPGKSGFDIVNEVRAENVNPTFIFVTAYQQYAIKAIRKAAFDYLLKPVDIDELHESLERFRNFREQSARQDIPSSFVKNFCLSEREVEIIRYLAQNKTSQEIADMLCLSRHTVDTHRRHILEKTGHESTNILIASLSNFRN